MEGDRKTRESPSSLSVSSDEEASGKLEEALKDRASSASPSKCDPPSAVLVPDPEAPREITIEEIAQYLDEQSRRSQPDKCGPVIYAIPIGTGRPGSNDSSSNKREPKRKGKGRVRFAESARDLGPLPLHPSVYKHTNYRQDLSYLPARLLRIGVTCTFPPDSFDRPDGNPEWSLRSIQNSRYREGINPRVVEYAAQFVLANGEDVAIEWLTFEELNWPWGIRIMRQFHQSKLLKPMDRRLEDPSITRNEWKGARSEWFNGKDIFKEEMFSKEIFLQTKLEQVAVYEAAAAATTGAGGSRGRNRKRSPPPPYRSPISRTYKKPIDLDTDPEDEDMTDASSTSSGPSYSETEDPDMWKTYHNACIRARAQDRSGTGTSGSNSDIKGKGKATTSTLSAIDEDTELEDEADSVVAKIDPMDLDATDSQADQKKDEEEAANKAAWLDKMRRASEQIQKGKREYRSGARSKTMGDEQSEDAKDEPFVPPAILPGFGIMPKRIEPPTDVFIPPSTLPGIFPPPRPQNPTSDATQVRWEKPLARKKGSRPLQGVGGKERNLGMTSDIEAEEEPDDGIVTADTDLEYEGDTEETEPPANKRIRESAASSREDLKRTRYFDQGGKMEGVERSSQPQQHKDEPKAKEGREKKKEPEGEGKKYRSDEYEKEIEPARSEGER